MKLNVNKNSKKGIAMTEYLIILGIVALGCICTVGVFGKEIKTVFSKEVAVLAGGTDASTDVTGEAKGAAGKKTQMVDFINAGN